MVDGAPGLSRRQLLLFGGAGAALLYAGRATLLPVGPGGHSAPRPEDRVVATPDLRGLAFSDAFANPALPGWNVRRPVAILGATPFGFGYAGNSVLDRPEVLQGRGTVIGLDGPMGASSGPGLIETADAFAFEPGATYRLRFSVAGSQQRADRLPASTVVASLPGLGVEKRVTRQPGDGFLEFDLDVPVDAVAMSTIVFSSENAPGQAGLLLESVSLRRVDADT